MALAPFVNIGVATGTVNGTFTSSWASNKSYAYDEAQYLQTDPVSGVIGTDTASLNMLIPSYTNKQLKSITVVPTTAASAADYLTLTQYTMYPVAFGTATGTACGLAVAGALVLGLQGNGTLLGTGINKVTINILNNLGVSVGGATGTQFAGLGTQAIYNPSYLQLSGGTATVIVTGPGGTNTQGGYVFPTGVNGGLTLNPGDVVVLARGTGSGQYAVEAECVFTPGGLVSR